MNVAGDVLEHKTLMIAVMNIAAEVARELEVDAGMSVAEMARLLGANRTSVYEQKGRLAKALSELVAARPGRPTADGDAPQPRSAEEMAQTIRVLEYRLEHLDAVVEHTNRTTYSASFRRFILEQHDEWPDTTARFAEACGVPLDTLNDWVREDRAGIVPEPPVRRGLRVAVDASKTTRSIVEDYQEWEGTTKDFVGLTAQRYRLTTRQVAKVLRICGAIKPRSRRPHRHRGTTKPLSPGAMLVTDGKALDVELTGSGRRIRRNWQGIADQTTLCDTATVVTEEEDAEAVRRAFDESVAFLGGVAPTGLLHDNKAPYKDSELRCQVEAAGTTLVPATLGRAQNKAGLEGAFSLFEARVGTIRLDDSSPDRLIDSAVGEIVRAYTAATNGVPRTELGGQSRQAALRTARPSAAQQAEERAFIANLTQRHERQRKPNWRERTKPASRRLLGHVFAMLGLKENDPHGRLQEYLSTYEPAAIRQAAVIVAPRLESGQLEREHAHRYLTKVIQSTQDMLDLERQEAGLLALCRYQAQDWVAQEQQEYEQLRRESDPEPLACALAERAAHGGLPVQGAFWIEKLVALLENAPQCLDRVRRFLVRLYEAPAERRLLLLDRLAAFEWGLA